MLLFNLLNLIKDFPNDGGPIYKETVQGRFPVEPFNTFSNFLFLFIFIYFSIKVYKDYRRHTFLAFALPVLFLCFFGGTMYHATRSSEIWLLLDWVPIVLLCFSVSVYFIFKTAKKIWQGILILLLVLLIVVGIRWIPGATISIGYIATALGLVLPLVLYARTTQFKHAKHILYAVAGFSVAVSFRTLDNFFEFLPMGTHWLWHSFGAVSVSFLMKYIYLDRTAPKP